MRQAEEGLVVDGPLNSARCRDMTMALALALALEFERRCRRGWSGQNDPVRRERDGDEV
jgi:hypothetical protein